MQQTNSSQLLYDNIVKFLTKKGTKNEKQNKIKTKKQQQLSDIMSKMTLIILSAGLKSIMRLLAYVHVCERQ